MIRCIFIVPIRTRKKNVSRKSGSSFFFLWLDSIILSGKWLSENFPVRRLVERNSVREKRKFRMCRLNFILFFFQPYGMNRLSFRIIISYIFRYILGVFFFIQKWRDIFWSFFFIFHYCIAKEDSICYRISRWDQLLQRKISCNFGWKLRTYVYPCSNFRLILRKSLLLSIAIEFL